MRRLIYAVAFLAAVLIVPTYLYSQSTWRLPVPGPLTTGSLMYARNANELGAISAVASGQVLTSQGTGTAPAWSSFTDGPTDYISLTTSLTPAVLACPEGSGTVCATSETFSNISGLSTSYRVFVNGPAPTSYLQTRCPLISASAPGTNQLRLTFAKMSTGDATCTPAAGDFLIFAVKT